MSSDKNGYFLQKLVAKVLDAAYLESFEGENLHGFRCFMPISESLLCDC